MDEQSDRVVPPRCSASAPRPRALSGWCWLVPRMIRRATNRANANVIGLVNLWQPQAASFDNVNLLGASFESFL
jgi:hypothetical protein